MRADSESFTQQVQSGGSFDVNYEVTGPGGRIIIEGEKERQGDFVFTANDAGEYKFCFANDMSTYTEKFVDFEIAVSAGRQASGFAEATDSGAGVDECGHCDLGRGRSTSAATCQAGHIA